MTDPEWVIDARQFLYKHLNDPWIWQVHTNETDEHGDSMTLDDDLKFPPAEASLVLDMAELDGISLEEFKARSAVHLARLRYEQAVFLTQFVDEETADGLRDMAEYVIKVATEVLTEIRPEYLYLLPSP